MNYQDYLDQSIQQHLSNERHYERTSKEVARKYVDESMNEFLNYISQPDLEISREDRLYLEEAAEKQIGICVLLHVEGT